MGFVAHLDTLGARVKRVEENGQLEVVQVGTWSAHFAEGARVKVDADGGLLTGTIVPVKASGHAFGKDVDAQPLGWNEVELRRLKFLRLVDPITQCQNTDVSSHGLENSQGNRSGPFRASDLCC